MSSSPRAGCLPRIGGALALDFANSTTGRGTDHFVEHLFDYEDLLRWSVFNEVLTPEAAAALQARVSPDEQASAFAAAMRVRALLNAVFDALAHGRPAETRALDTLADLAKEAWRTAVLRSAGPAYAWRFEPPDARPDGLLGPILRSAVDGADPARPVTPQGLPGRALRLGVPRPDEERRPGLVRDGSVRDAG